MLGRRKKIGSIAEEEAVRYLQELGWKLVQRNYRCRIGEIDIIARDPRGFLVFVEVRSRSGKGYGSPEEVWYLGSSISLDCWPINTYKLIQEIQKDPAV
ncbi:hypothetical protein N752_23375 [Desulforamulus aquiferis]|nr:YraN family protein [Desulforamulus aquiferis]RYD02724.1 hypothetical protein N752_23375 [Desulforamulus aquiferis]